jgi:hypothetical protein
MRPKSRVRNVDLMRHERCELDDGERICQAGRAAAGGGRGVHIRILESSVVGAKVNYAAYLSSGVDSITKMEAETW